MYSLLHCSHTKLHWLRLNQMITPPTLHDFFVVTVVSNTARYSRRYVLYEHFKKMVAHSGVKMVTVELAFGDRPFEVTCGPPDLQIRTQDEFWHKENCLNLGIAHGQRMFPGAKYVAWIDADCAPIGCSFLEWMEETWQQLQHYEFVQCWSKLQNLDIRLQPIDGPRPSFMYNYITFGTPYPPTVCKTPYNPGAVSWGAPGLAWAACLSALNHIGQIPDWAILGAGDWYLAHMLISDLTLPGFDGYSPGYTQKFMNQQALCEQWIKRDVGFVPIFTNHFWHGKSANRQYDTRENILKQCQFDPNTDLKRDHQGLYQLETNTPRQIQLRDRIRAYFRQRNEDGTDL